MHSESVYLSEWHMNRPLPLAFFLYLSEWEFQNVGGQVIVTSEMKTSFNTNGFVIIRYVHTTQVILQVDI